MSPIPASQCGLRKCHTDRSLVDRAVLVTAVCRAWIDIIILVCGIAGYSRAPDAVQIYGNYFFYAFTLAGEQGALRMTCGAGRPRTGCRRVAQGRPARRARGRPRRAARPRRGAPPAPIRPAPRRQCHQNSVNTAASATPLSRRPRCTIVCSIVFAFV